MKPTVTPAPVMPSDRAVFAPGSCESAWIVSSACGSSCTLPGGAHAPGIGDVPGGCAELACPARGGASWMTWSGMTWLTAGFDCEL